MRMNSQFDGNRAAADFGWSKRACTTNKKHWIDVFDECRQAGHDFSDGSVAQRKWYQTFKNYNMGRDGGEVMPLSLRDESSFCIQWPHQRELDVAETNPHSEPPTVLQSVPQSSLQRW
ncbi:uncharacterized protein [Physcomitrium patens]|uniref:Uncharacterized protein n=1 Tax=Physcomitrium patens TaxID=3218 RepID=A0A2K1JBL3_PHYPA|nr:uncharacterized protein LOC112292186 isoform X1 [Physcomitrium patens]XP_024396194.1 uncharacterized protein LOC112292186 isoform X1 [Physcomitrium patens]PNR38904.1 hypothetical protein PHYPA_019182 [Physcomitrium patens]|eukprot:XP_024396193.1 uncharacterized protein LOC112292186 isoform X1 [Physcomitrella patens]